MLWMPGVPVILNPFYINWITRDNHQAIFINDRLYANMMAGHVVLMSIIGLMFILKVDWQFVVIGTSFFLSILDISCFYRRIFLQCFLLYILVLVMKSIIMRKLTIKLFKQ
jgi:F-type H+-transporting ATPase subunit a